MKSKLKITCLSFVFLVLNPCVSFAKDNESYNWIFRSRALFVKTDVSSKISNIGGHVAASSAQAPEFDITRFVTPNVAFELIAATTKHDISGRGTSSGNLSLGSVKLLPPTLTAQYHFNPTGTFRPYTGAGLNYTFFYGTKNSNGFGVKYQDHLGYALQAGFDYMIDSRFGINFDVKKIFLSTKAHVNNTYTAKVRLDPWIIGAGVSYRF